MLCASAALSAGAQSFDEVLTASYNGQPITEGSTIYVTDYEDNTEYNEGYSYLQGHIKVTNKTEEPVALRGVFLYSEPSKATADAAPETWGMASMCYEGAEIVNNSSAASCLGAGNMDAGAGNVWVPAAGTDTFSWLPHLENCAADAVSTYRFLMQPLTADFETGEIFGDNLTDPLSFNICFRPNLNAVDRIDADSDSAAVYYNLQGVRVAEPTHGAYIRVKGAKSEKVVISE